MTGKILPSMLLALLASSMLAHGQPLESPRSVEATITERECRALVAHRAADDVAYQPGRDVHGRPIAPADLPGSPSVPALSTIRIPLTLSLGDIFAIPPAIDADIPLWTITVEADGRAYIDGQPLYDEAAAQVAEVCRSQFGL